MQLPDRRVGMGARGSAFGRGVRRGGLVDRDDLGALRCGLPLGLGPPHHFAVRRRGGLRRGTGQRLEGGGELVLPDRFLEEVVRPEVEDVGEVADRPAEAAAQRDRDRGALPGAAQLRHQHRGVGPHRAHHDRRRRRAVTQPTGQPIRRAAGRFVAERSHTPGQPGAARLVSHDEDLRRHPHRASYTATRTTRGSADRRRRTPSSGRHCCLRAPDARAGGSAASAADRGRGRG